MTLTSQQIETRVRESIRKTVNKFRENPYYFFTESDIVTYFCRCLYSSNLEIVRNGRRIYLVHREYPTNFRYRKNELLNKSYQPALLSQKIGGRGHFDIAVLNPDFVQTAQKIEDIVNKDVRDLELRTSYQQDEVLFAIEFKYVTNNSQNFVDGIRKDNRKLYFAYENGVRHVINLVFCNLQPKNLLTLERTIENADPNVEAYFIQSYYDNDNKKITPKPLIRLADSSLSINQELSNNRNTIDFIRTLGKILNNGVENEAKRIEIYERLDNILGNYNFIPSDIHDECRRKLVVFGMEPFYSEPNRDSFCMREMCAHLGRCPITDDVYIFTDEWHDWIPMEFKHCIERAVNMDKSIKYFYWNGKRFIEKSLMIKGE